MARSAVAGVGATKLAGSATQQLRSHPIIGGGAALLLLFMILLFFLASPDFLPPSKDEDIQFLKDFPAERAALVQQLNQATAITEKDQLQSNIKQLDGQAKAAQNRLGANATDDDKQATKDANQAAAVEQAARQ